MYPSRFDIIWAVKPPYDVLEVAGSEGIAGLDDGIGGVGPVVGVEEEIGEVGGKEEGEGTKTNGDEEMGIMKVELV